MSNNSKLLTGIYLKETSVFSEDVSRFFSPSKFPRTNLFFYIHYHSRQIPIQKVQVLYDPDLMGKVKDRSLEGHQFRICGRNLSQIQQKVIGEGDNEQEKSKNKTTNKRIDRKGVIKREQIREKCETRNRNKRIERRVSNSAGKGIRNGVRRNQDRIRQNRR